MDFTVKKPQLDIAPEENRIYLEGYLRVLKNEISLIWEDEVKYYKDLWKSGTEFEELLKEKDTRRKLSVYLAARGGLGSRTSLLSGKGK